MRLLIIRFFDIFIAFFGILFLLPFLSLIGVLIKIDSNGEILFKQIRVGFKNCDFELLKFRTMFTNSDKSKLLTIGERDNRITRLGFYLRKYKIDELPQLFNVLKGNMSLVGPRPEVRKYVNMYSDEQIKILSVKPGLTDYASIFYKSENNILSKSQNPEYTYINEIIPEKIKLNLKYIQNPSVYNYFKIIFLTLYSIFKT